MAHAAQHINRQNAITANNFHEAGACPVKTTTGPRGGKTYSKSYLWRRSGKNANLGAGTGAFQYPGQIWDVPVIPNHEWKRLSLAHRIPGGMFWKMNDEPVVIENTSLALILALLAGVAITFAIVWWIGSRESGAPDAE